jgi:hypothetical protein
MAEHTGLVNASAGRTPRAGYGRALRSVRRRPAQQPPSRRPGRRLEVALAASASFNRLEETAEARDLALGSAWRNRTFLNWAHRASADGTRRPPSPCCHPPALALGWAHRKERDAGRGSATSSRRATVCGRSLAHTLAMATSGRVYSVTTIAMASSVSRATESKIRMWRTRHPNLKVPLPSRMVLTRGSTGFSDGSHALIS